MEFSDYQEAANLTAIYPLEHVGTYPLIGLIGEVGEFANKYKKILRDDADFPHDDMVSELGDILWYLSVLASDLDIDMDEVATSNISKLHGRKERGTLGGSGDKR